MVRIILQVEPTKEAKFKTLVYMSVDNHWTTTNKRLFKDKWKSFYLGKKYRTSEAIHESRIHRKTLQLEHAIVYLIKNTKCVDERPLGFHLSCSENLRHFSFRNNEKPLFFQLYAFRMKRYWPPGATVWWIRGFYRIKLLLRLPRFLHRREWHNLTRLTKRKRATRKINDENNMTEHHRFRNHTIECDSAQCLTYSTNHFRLLTLKSWLQKSTITDAIEATYTFFLFGNRTKRPKITDGWKVTNHDRPTPQESYGQQHHG